MPGSTERSLSMLAAALEKEEFGRDFFAKAMNDCKNELGKDIFRTLLKEEGVHIARIKHIYDALAAGRAWSDEWKSYKGTDENLQRLFRERLESLAPGASADTGDIEAINLGLEFEQGAIKFYEAHLPSASDDLERAFVQTLIKEERTHYATLSDIKLFLTNPESYYTELEHHVLDGA
ncbi:MAG: ferritin family protein [Thermodesulfobacteriota bacterium]